MPAELVTTCWLPMVLAARVVPPEAAGLEAAAELLPAAAGVLLVAVLLLELAHADTVSARAASVAAPHIFRISDFPLRSAK
jgi:hypothetical protein